MARQTKVSEKKKAIVKEFVSLIEEYPIIGVVNMENLPGSQLQQMRGRLKGQIKIAMTKKRLLKRAFDAVGDRKKGVSHLVSYFKGIPALLFTNENPFLLFKIIKKNKSKAPAKAGQPAPHDIKIAAGPTPFAPGPVIGELGMLGIKSKVENGKIAIIQDTVVCEAGEEISPQLASMLAKLNILPMEIGLDVVAVYEKGEIFTKDILDIDEDKFMATLAEAIQCAFNLAVEAAYPTAENNELLLQKASREAKALALEGKILTDAAISMAEGETALKEAAIPAQDKYGADEKPAQSAAHRGQKIKEEPTVAKAHAKKPLLTEEKVEKMVKQVRDKTTGKIPTATTLLDEVKSEDEHRMEIDKNIKDVKYSEVRKQKESANLLQELGRKAAQK